MRSLRILLALVLVVAWVPGAGTQDAPLGPLRIHFVDVGQGDGVLIQSPSGQNVVYDGGENADRMRDYLLSAGVQAVDLVIASHNHADHIGGLAEVVRRFKPRLYMDNAIPATTLTYSRTLEAVREAGSELLEPISRRIQLGDAALTVIPPPRNSAWDQNDNSIGVLIEFGAFRMSLMGDAERREWAWWLAEHPTLLRRVQIHKASHHGSNNGDTAEGLQQLTPGSVAIGVGAGNSYGHPNGEALRLYEGQAATVYRTDEQGTIVFEAHQNGAYAARVERVVWAQPPPRTTPVVSVQALHATTERNSATGTLSYPIRFEVRETGGVAVTLGAVAATISGGITGTATLPAPDLLASATLPAGVTFASSRMVLNTTSALQATRVAIRVPWSTDTGLTGTAEASANIQPAVCPLPATPSNLQASVTGTTVAFSWSTVTGATDYLLTAGASGGSNALSTTTAATTYTWSNAAPGNYSARVTARNTCGSSPASNEIPVTVANPGGGGGGGGGTPPSSFSGPLPSVGAGNTCSASVFPSVVSCVNNQRGAPTALCRNGNYSCSQNRSGTCSGNGGVHCWVCPGPLCSSSVVAAVMAVEIQACAVMEHSPEEWLESLRPHRL